MIRVRVFVCLMFVGLRYLKNLRVDFHESWGNS